MFVIKIDRSNDMKDLNKEGLENLEKIQYFQSMIEDVESLGVYNPRTKEKINQCANELISMSKDWRSHCLKTSLKKDLIKNIVNVCKSNIKVLEERNKTIQLQVLEDVKKEGERKERDIANELAAKIYPYREEYIRDFESINMGIRQWNCLYDLVQSGDVKEDQLIDYGIDLSIPPSI